MKGKCKIEGCEKDAVKCGMCRRHQNQIYLFGAIIGDVSKSCRDRNEFIEEEGHIKVFATDTWGNTKGFFLIDMEDWERVKQYKWSIDTSGYVGSGSVEGKKIRLHALLTGFEATTHVNKDKLDNRRLNLKDKKAIKNEKCKVERCETLQKSKGFCLKHYTQMLRNGKIGAREKIEGCKVEGCNRKHRAKGYCDRHFKQVNVFGEIKGNPSKTMFDPNEFIVNKEEKIVYIKFCGLLGEEKEGQGIIDLDDFEKVKQHKWYIDKNGYIRTKTKVIIALHHFIMGCIPEEGFYTDHINMNKSDNRKQNLRLCTKGENAVNSKLRADNKTGAKGIFEYTPGKWKARVGGEHIGCFLSPEEAARAYDKKLIEKYGKFARTNEMEGR